MERQIYLNETVIKKIDKTSAEHKEKQSITPYVVSGDIYLLLKQWVKKNSYALPNPDFFVKLRSDFTIYMKHIFPGFQLISEEEISNGLKELVDSSGLFPVSLDRVYYPSKVKIDITRIINSEGQGRGLRRRNDSSSLLQQFRKFRFLGLKEVALVDDVIFTGDLLERTSVLLEKFGVKVKAIFAGIGISEGINRLLKSSKRQILCVKTYPKVIDEICERDFYPGVPLSGRSIAKENDTGAPYILPFGNPGKWASIPTEWQAPFSKFCIGQTIKLFEAIEFVSNKPIRCLYLERKVVSLPKDETRFIDALKQVYKYYVKINI